MHYDLLDVMRIYSIRHDHKKLSNNGVRQVWLQPYPSLRSGVTGMVVTMSVAGLVRTISVGPVVSTGMVVTISVTCRLFMFFPYGRVASIHAAHVSSQPYFTVELPAYASSL